MSGFRWLLMLSLVTIPVVFSLAATSHLKGASVIQQLTTHPATDVRPIWSPDGQSIAYQSNQSGSYSIWVMEANGQNQREITPGDTEDRHPAWSPDGQKLAFTSNASGSREIWMVGKDGQNLQQVTSLGAVASFPGWSPDGTEIAFYLYKDGMMNLWSVQIGSDTPRPLTSNLADERRNQCTFACHQAAWSPDGQKLTYTGGDQRSIWMIDADGSNPTEIVSGKENNNHFPWYTADGRVGYLTEHITAAESWTDAWLLNLANGEVTLLLERIQHQGPLEWSPDGTKVMFHSPRSGNFDIYVVDLSAEGGPEVMQGESEQVPLSSNSPSGHPQEIPLAPTTSAASAEANEAPAAPEATNQAASVSLPMILGVIGLIGLMGLIVIITVFRRKPRV